MLSADAACVCSLDVTLLIGSQFACMAGLQEKDVHGNAKFRLTPLTRAQMHTQLIATGFWHQAKFPEWMCLLWVEGDHCYVHMMFYDWVQVVLHIPCAPKRRKTWVCTVYTWEELFAPCLSMITLSLWWNLQLITRLGRAIEIWPHMCVVHLWPLWFMPTMLIHIGESWGKTWVILWGFNLWCNFCNYNCLHPLQCDKAVLQCLLLETTAKSKQ